MAAVVTDDLANSGFIFTMEITGLKVGREGFGPTGVHQTYWKLTGEMPVCPKCGESHTAAFQGATPLRKPTVDANGDGFIDWEDLTEEAVIEWVSDILKQDLHPFARIVAQIDALHEVDVAEFPWSTPTVTEVEDLPTPIK